MPEHPATALVCQLDLGRRTVIPVRRWSVLLAGHLVGHPSLPSAEAVLADLRNGRPAAAHLSPMKNARRAFKRAHRRGNWVDYKRMMDHLLNKWDFHHFHCAGGSVLVFVHLCEETSVARVLDLVPHDGNWLVERRLVEIAVRNWPASGIVRCFGKGPSSMTEQDLFDARKQGADSDECGHAFQSMVATDSNPRRSGIPMIPAGVVIDVVMGSGGSPGVKHDRPGGLLSQ